MKYYRNILFLLLYFLAPAVAYAAKGTEVYFQNTAKQITPKTSFVVDLDIASDTPINVVDGTITYDPQLLVVQSISTDASILMTWVKQPLYDNQQGTLSFIGGVPNGFSGGSGELLHITFLAKKAGVTTLGFRDVFSVLKNDGLGTEVNPWLEPLSLSITKKPSLFVRYYNIAAKNHYLYYLLGAGVLCSVWVFSKRRKR
ncbi:MAG TPA: cohesin domain-containing protein [Candidatus Paceibacterota bacterium]|nr:cohesin domain-containing protein [Candidatus Paceibacterota bacterium]